MPSAINLAERLARVRDYWTPQVVAGLNDYEVKVVKVKGQFVWHCHRETDELFLVLRGELRIELRDGAVDLRTGGRERLRGGGDGLAS